MREELTMNDQIESEIADDTHQAQAAVRTRCGRPPLWAILLSVSLVAVDIIGRRRLAPNFAKGAVASSEVKHDEPAQTPSQLPQRGWKDILLRVFTAFQMTESY
jgi:hypothetical protein